MAKTETKAKGEAPRRKVGRPKGTPKSPGSGRVKRTRIQIARDKARDSIWDYVVKGLSGQAVKSRGPTGKQISQPLTEDNQIRLLQTAWRKLEPDLNATAVSADIKSETIHTEPKDPRQLGRAVLSILEHAKLADEPPVAEPFEDPRPQPHQLLLGRDAYIETNSASDRVDPSISSAALSNGEASGEVSPSSSTNSSSTPSGEMSERREGSAPSREAGTDVSALRPDKPPKNGDVVKTSNGGHLWYVESKRKWAIFDNLNLQHCWKADKAEAIAHSEANIPRYDGMVQPHPFAEVTAQTIGSEPRRDNQQYMPRAALKIVRERPR